MATTTTVLRATPGRVLVLALGVPLMLAGVAWSALSVVAVLARTSERHHVAYPWSGGGVSLNVGDGDVQIRAADTRTVGVDYTEHYSLKRPTVKATSSAAGIVLSAHCAGGVFQQNCQINYVITVPKQAALRLQLGDGSLSLQSVTASVVVQAGDGSIDGSDLGSKSLQISAGDGSVHLQWAVAPARVNLDAGDGSVDISVPRGSGPYAIQRSGSGSADIEVANDPAAAATMVLHTGDGSMHVGYGS